MELSDSYEIENLFLHIHLGVCAVEKIERA